MSDMQITEVALRERDKSRVGMVLSGGPPNRHYNLCRQIIEWGGNPDDFEQGFKTATGEFVDRRRAAALALASGQVSELIAPPELFSEDLW